MKLTVLTPSDTERDRQTDRDMMKLTVLTLSHKERDRQTDRQTDRET